MGNRLQDKIAIVTGVSLLVDGGITTEMRFGGATMSN
jgi:hypothetical protein